MPAKSIMIQGTTSSAGKTTLATGLCRLLARKGLRVAPFKPQNMALNSAVTADGGEIGRAQALQAVACGVQPSVDMNPVLLKPSTNTGAQVIVQGRVLTEMDARGYHAAKPKMMPYILQSYSRLADSYDVIVIEGAGSPAEINLRDGDVANMGFAEAIDCPVLLVGDIDRGGVFAHLIGTLSVLSPSEQSRIKGFVINKFRGDVTLLDSGISWLEQESNKPVFGVLPFIQNVTLDAEDSLSRITPRSGKGTVTEQSPTTTQVDDAASTKVNIVVPMLPRLSNDSDFQPLAAHPLVSFQYVRAGQNIPAGDLIILPGSKSVACDLAWLRENGWESHIRKHLRYGGKLIGICGGFQMLGKTLHDPHGIESNDATMQALGLLDMETEFQPHKQLTRVSGKLNLPGNPVVEGYEIHMGTSSGPALATPAVLLDGRNDGAVSEDRQIIGTYVHGILDSAQTCAAILSWVAGKQVEAGDFRLLRERSIDQVADTMAEHIHLNAIYSLLSL